jgi:hypothetical protein
MTDVLARLCPHTGSRNVAASDLTEAMAKGDLHCLSRYPTHHRIWERQLVSFLCWAGYELSGWSDGKLRVFKRPEFAQPGLMSWDGKLFAVRRPGIKFTQPGLMGGVLYAWLPDLERIWPTVFPPVMQQSEEPAEWPVEQKPTSPRPGSADAWIEELFPSTWRLLKPKKMHAEIVKEVEKRNEEAKKRGKNAPRLQAPSMTAIRAALKSRRQKPSAQKTRKTQLRF